MIWRWTSNGFNKTILPEDHNENFLIIFSKELTFFNMNSIYLDYEVSKIVSYFKEAKTYNTKKLETFRYDDQQFIKYFKYTRGRESFKLHKFYYELFKEMTMR